MKATANETLAELATRYLRPWRDSGIGLAALNDAHLRWADYRDPAWGGFVPMGEAHNRLLRINIVANQLYYVGCAGSKSAHRLARQEAALRLVQLVLDGRSLPDVDMVLSISDRPTVPRSLVRIGSVPPAVFSYALTPAHYALPFPPVSFDPRRWAPLHAQLRSHPPLGARRTTALWRGSCNSLCDMMRRRTCEWPRDARLLPRTQLLRAASRCPRLCDVGITSSHRHCAGFLPKRAVAMSGHARHALLVHVDGNGFSGRLDELLTLGSAVMRQRSLFSAYYYPLLRPGVHYEPLTWNLSDLCPRARALTTELIAHNVSGARSRAQRLAKGATRFAARYLSPEAVSTYVASLLEQYAALQRFTPSVHPHAVPWRGGGGRGGRFGGKLAPSSAATETWTQPSGTLAGRCSGVACCRRHPKSCVSRPP